MNHLFRRGVHAALIVISLLVFPLASCSSGSGDPELDSALASFKELTAKLGDRVGWTDTDQAFVLAPSAGDKFLVNPDFREGSFDFELQFAPEVFLAAGLDPSKILSDSHLRLNPQGVLVFSFEWAGEGFNPSKSSDNLDALLGTMEGIFKVYRPHLSYHESFDTYSLDLGGGNRFEWAKSPDSNDKDVVFLLDPQSLAEAGLDPAALAGWASTPVEFKDAQGTVTAETKLLRSFDL